MSDAKQLTGELADKLKSILQERLVSVCLYGSAVDANASHQVEQKANINTLAIVRDFVTADLEQLAPVSQWWEKKAHALPMFLSEHEWHNASDIFALEYSDIKERHWVACGEDLFSGITVDTQSLRLVCEAEVYRKLMFLRQRLLLFREQPEKLKTYMRESLHHFDAVFRGILRIHGQEQVTQYPPEQIYQHLSQLVSGLDASVLTEILDAQTLKNMEQTPTVSLFKRYIEQLCLVNDFLNR